ncbi:MAG: Na(+)-translocating NADH-quinone reductase subunit A [Nitrospinota bacterium]|nr:Na(+)-translocating NADH-quinone reductase subunit A [Nitrospinota bacterium]
MTTISIKKGYDLKVAGSAAREVVSAKHPTTIAIHPVEFRGIKPKLLVQEGDKVRGGSPLFSDKVNPAVRFVAPHSGVISSINYGERRRLDSIIITPDSSNDPIDFGAKDINAIQSMSRAEAVTYLQDSGAFTYLRQRPFNSIPDSGRPPKSIFINAMNSAPNSLDQEFVLEGRENELQLGIYLIKKLTEGKVHLCHTEGSKLFTSLSGVEKHAFTGPHPSGLVGTHIHFIDPINKGDIVWYISAMHLAAIGSLLKTGHFDPETVVAMSGEGLKNRKYVKTIIGADLKGLIGDGLEKEEQRIVSGTVLYGTAVDLSGHILYYNNDLQVIPEGRKRRFLGWMMPGLDQFSVTARVFLSSLIPSGPINYTTNINGGHRALVWTDVYDNFTPLGIYTNFLLRSVLAENLEEMEQLGIFEVAEEDFALATYVCPSKIDVSAIIGKGLATIEKEGY